MTTAKTTSKKSPAKKASSKASKSSSSKKENPCWPGFEPVAGKAARTKGSCKPESRKHSKATKRATQKAAAASKLEKAGKPNPKASK